MGTKRLQILNIRPGEWGLVLSLLLLLAINTLVLELSDVVATAGFISSIGTPQIIWLWVVDMVITLFSTGLYALIVDRTPRVKLLGWLFGGLAFLYLVLQLLFTYGAPDWLTYPLLYIVADQQYVIFPLTLWMLANDVFSMAESKRLFPVIGAGYALGSIAGNALAAGSGALLSKQGAGVTPLLTLGALTFLVGLALLWFTFRKREVRARQSQQPGSVRETIKVGADVIGNVPLFRFLAIAMLLAGLSLTIIEFHFLFTVDQAVASSPLKFQAFYGAYKVVLIITLLLFQWLVTGRFLEKAGLKNAFIVLPVSLLGAAGAALAFAGITGGAAGRFLARLVQQGWDEPARKALQNLVPDERRGRVSAFLDSYFYAVATIIGCLFLGGLFLCTSLGWLQAEWAIIVYLIVAGLAGIGALLAALRLRSEYDGSLLNWRLARSRRKSMLDGIEF
jgi:AAA family ATP:ADP antiporter